ncbi:MAG: fructose-bisphosphatase class II [Candidatus Daviesbacteria bacterium]|nr:fructose-bisphosphatase class II [Candidatus Daviesbacteria bacterium]
MVEEVQVRRPQEEQMQSQVKNDLIRATELTAIAVSKLIYEKGFSKDDVLGPEESKEREKLIDQTGADAMAAALTDVPFVIHAISSEGGKHIFQYGEALPTLLGDFGEGEIELDMVNDVVEGSKAAKLNSPGAVSVLAASTHGGIMKTPDDIFYMDKLFGSPQLKGKISLNNSTEQNLQAAVDAFDVDPSEITVVIMNRPRNEEYRKACEAFGVKIVLIEAGDMLPAVLASEDPSTHNKGIHLVMGIGGFEEGVMCVVGAKLLGSACEVRPWSADPEINAKYAQVLGVDDVVSGEIEDSFLSLSSITGDSQWLGLPKVTEKDGGHEVTTLTVSPAGVNISTTLTING